jgi:predicted transcriptional regulator of viral defense system
VGLQHPEVDTLVAAAAANAMGVLSREELRSCGLTDEGIKVRLRTGRLHRLHRGVYAVGHTAVTREASWLAAVKACGPHAVLSHSSSAMLFGFLRWEDRLPDVTIPAAAKCLMKGIRVHRTRSLLPRDVLRHRGVPTTSAARTIFDLAATSNDIALRRMMSRAQAMRLTNRRALAQQLDHAAGRAGRARYVRVLASNPPPTRSELEDRLHDLVLAGGFQPPDVNVPMHVQGRRVIPDLRWPEQRLCVEADGREWHDNPQARHDDEERQALLEAHGERGLRVTWEQATAHVAQTLQRLHAAGAPR